jgi:hypothetical protein
MKKITLFLFIVCVCHFTDAQKLSFGVKPSLLLLDGKYVQKPAQQDLNFKPRVSYGLGITINDQLGKFFSVQVEPRFITRGLIIEDKGSLFDNGYLSIPALVFFHPVKNLNIEAGLDFTYYIKLKRGFYSGSTFGGSGNPSLRHFELSSLLGISYSISDRFDLGIRYGLALTPHEKGSVSQYKDPYSVEFVPYKFYHRYFEFYLNTRLSFKQNN